MKMTPPSREWLETMADFGDPPSCPGCGAMAGCCSDFPNCPGGFEVAPEAPLAAAAENSAPSE